MSWLPILALAAVAFGVAAFALRVPRPGYTLLGAALLFGLAGYAFQGSPGLGSAPGMRSIQPPAAGAALVEARRQYYGAAFLPSRFLITSDAYARRGDSAGAADFARNAVEENPGDGEAWVALGNALVDHAGGRLTPPALYAYGQGERVSRGNPAPAYFLGLAYLRGGEPEKTRGIWNQLLARAPPDAPWRELLAARLRLLDAMLRADSAVAAPPPR